MNKSEQNNTPLFDAVKKYIDDDVIRFHVPGHKSGRGIKEFKDYIGEKALQIDVNGMDELDYLDNPSGVIKEAEELTAKAFGADYAYFLANGSSGGVHAMIMSACEPGDKILIPRNAHKSTIGGIILSGAMPVFIQPEINEQYGIAMGITQENLKQAINENPHAKAVYIINPTYYGCVPDLKNLVKIAHAHDMTVIVDEAHGAHMYFNKKFPLTAMEVGADITTLSMHKTGGSLTQSSILLLKGNRILPEKVKQILNLISSSSASYLLMCSLDLARKQMAIKGKEMLDETLEHAKWARNEINKIQGLHSFGKEITKTPGCYDYDETKLVINVHGIGYTGYEIEEKLRKEYNIQIELSDINNILAIVSIGDEKRDIELLVDAMKDIAEKSKGVKIKKSIKIPHNPQMIITPRDAFYSLKKTVALAEAEGEIAGEMLMAYPPGIPVVCFGERITKDIIDYIEVLKNEKCELQGAADINVDYLRVLGTE